MPAWTCRRRAKASLNAGRTFARLTVTIYSAFRFPASHRQFFVNIDRDFQSVCLLR